MDFIFNFKGKALIYNKSQGFKYFFLMSCFYLLQTLCSKSFSERQVFQIRRLFSSNILGFESASGRNGIKAGNSSPATNKHYSLVHRRSPHEQALGYAERYLELSGKKETLLVFRAAVRFAGPPPAEQLLLSQPYHGHYQTACPTGQETPLPSRIREDYGADGAHGKHRPCVNPRRAHHTRPAPLHMKTQPQREEAHQGTPLCPSHKCALMESSLPSENSCVTDGEFQITLMMS